MDHHLALAAAKQQQRQAAIAFLARRTPTEAARALLADHRVIDPRDVGFLAAVITRTSRLVPDARDRLVSIATPLMPPELAA